MNTDQQYADGLLMEDASPLKVVICSYEKRWGSESGVKGRKWPIVRAVNKLSLGQIGLEASEDSIIPEVLPDVPDWSERERR